MTTPLLGLRRGLRTSTATISMSSWQLAVRLRARVICPSLKNLVSSRSVSVVPFCSSLRASQKHVERIRADYQADLRNKTTQLRMRATAMYFIDVLALRAGNEKGEDEADTVGCCSLRCEHVTLEPPNYVIFDFLGKDSIRYYNKVTVDEQVFKNIKIFKRDKQDSHGLFDRVNVSALAGLRVIDTNPDAVSRFT
jgi:Eukaryotic DNA topoisomerase I, catalytic core